ncbi:MAG: hypothetical protein ACRDM7_12820 [Thermoleophilaceae bacterium]
MTLRTLIVAVIVTTLVSIGGATVVATQLLERGPAGGRGPAGPAGPEGPPGEADVNTADVISAVEQDPGSVAIAVQDYLDPTPGDLSSRIDDTEGTVSDVESAIDDVATRFDRLCSTLQFADALSDEFLSC